MTEPLKFIPHGQQIPALRSKAPITLLATGVQYGKTTVGALWLKLKMHQFTDPLDNFIVTAPTYKILSQSTLPPILRYMDGYGELNKQEMMFQMYGGGRCWFRTATDADSIVGITNTRAIYGDEAGLYSLYFWENMQARAAFKSAPILLTTSPYTLNWVFKELIRPKQKDPTVRPDVLYLKARSVDNPYFPKDYYERMRETMDPRRFNAMFGGEWEKMDGLVYKCFDEEQNSINPHQLPIGTKYYAGVDWGTAAPFAMVIIAMTPDGDYFQVTEVYKTGLGITDMVALAKQKMQSYKIEQFFCDPSGKGHILEFCNAGIPAVAANNDVKVGIGLVYDLIARRKFKLFRGDNKHTEDEISTYHFPSEKEMKEDTETKDDLPVKQNDHACFVAGTMINHQRIEDVRAGDMITTSLGRFEVEESGLVGFSNVVTVCFSNGKRITGTANHPIYAYGRGFIPFQDLTQYDIVSSCKDQKPSALTEKIITLAVRIINALAGFPFIVLFTSIIMGLFQMALKFTMLILIISITILQTWLPFIQRSIRLFTKKPLPRNVENKDLITFYRSTILQSLGTQVKKAMSGIKNMVLSVGRKESPDTSLVSSAVKVSKQKLSTQDFARTLASLLLDVKLSWIILKQLAQFAIPLFSRVSTKDQKPVRVLAVLNCVEKQNVYNLKIKNLGAYEANGFLVSNCDALRYCLSGIYRGDHRRTPRIISQDRPEKLTIEERMERIRQLG